jgi:hypothetical protein
MRARSNDPAAKPRLVKRRSEPSTRTGALKKQQPLTSPVDDDVAQDDAPDVALTDIESADERAADSVETLPELEREIGISDWIDPQTGEPAEGQSPPHLEEE